MPDHSSTRIASMCLGKVAFSTPQLAKKVQRRRRDTKAKHCAKEHAYRCKVCGYFHIGTQTKPRQNATSGRAHFRFYEIEDDLSMA